MKQKSWFFEKINMIDKLLDNLSKMRREKTQINKLEMKKGKSQQIPRKSKESLGITLKTYIQINWKI
jgi:hypothetical protein